MEQESEKYRIGGPWGKRDDCNRIAEEGQQSVNLLDNPSVLCGDIDSGILRLQQ